MLRGEQLGGCALDGVANADEYGNGVGTAVIPKRFWLHHPNNGSSTSQFAPSLSIPREPPSTSGHS